MLLVSPQVEAEKVRMPRDLVLVLDTSSSMSELKMAQAKKALKYCLSQLGPDDRFAVIKFSTSVVKLNCPPASCPLITRGLRLARAA